MYQRASYYSQLMNSSQTIGSFWSNSFFYLTILWLTGFLIGGGPFFEKYYVGIYRHLTPFYLSVILYVVVVLESRRFYQIKISQPVWLKTAFFISFLVAVMTIYSRDVESGLAAACRWGYIYFILAFFWELKLEWKGAKYVLYGIAFGTLILAIDILQFRGWDFTNITMVGLGYLNRNLISSSMLSGFLSLMIIYQHQYKSNVLSRVFLATAMILALYLIILTYSRSALLSLILIVVLYLWTHYRRIFQFYWARFLFISMILVAIFTIYYVPNYLERLYLREDTTLSTFSTGRTDLWWGAIEGSAEMSFLGAGSGDSSEALEKSESFRQSRYYFLHGGGNTHNAFLKLLTENGMIGFIGGLIFGIGMLLFSWQHRYRYFFVTITGISCLLMIFFADYIYTSWLVFAAYLSSSINKEILQQKFGF